MSAGSWAIRAAAVGTAVAFGTAAAFGTAVAAQDSLAKAPDLSAEQRAIIDAGRQVVHEERVVASPWPRVTVIQFIDASPREAIAVFADYALHSAYLPGVKKSVISRRISPRVTEVDYVLEVPIFPDEDYTVRDSLSSSDDGASYRVDWVKVRARSTKEIVGTARFEPYRNGATAADGALITYVNLVRPGQRLAGPLKGRALKQVRETVTALARQIEAERKDEPGLLATQMADLATALAAQAAPPPMREEVSVAVTESRRPAARSGAPLPE
jgi:hypothetical protein